MVVSRFTARSSSNMDLPLEVTVGEVETSLFSQTNVLLPSHPSHREYWGTPAVGERERGNMDELVRQSPYEYL
jgi:hypothetical protein